MEGKSKTKKNVAPDFIQVGHSWYDKIRRYRYSDIPMSLDGWCHHGKYRPENFDLVFLKIEGRLKSLSGWWDGTTWAGRLVKPEHKVKAWKRNGEC